jgi:hypothetical protein
VPQADDGDTSEDDDDDEDTVERKAKICPMCDETLPAPCGAIAGGDGSHRPCISNGLRSGLWTNIPQYYKACEVEAETRANNAAAEAKAKEEAKAPRKRVPREGKGRVH